MQLLDIGYLLFACFAEEERGRHVIKTKVISPCRFRIGEGQLSRPYVSAGLVLGRQRYTPVVKKRGHTVLASCVLAGQSFNRFSMALQLLRNCVKSRVSFLNRSKAIFS